MKKNFLDKLYHSKYSVLLVWSIVMLCYGFYNFIFFGFANEIYGYSFGMLIRICFLLSMVVVWIAILGITIFFDKININKKVD